MGRSDSDTPATAVRSRILLGSIRPTVFWLALPVLCEQFLSFLVGFYDTWASGRFGAEATSAVGLSAYVSWLASMIFSVVGTGTTALVARHWGAGEFAQANGVANRSLAMAASLGTLVFLLIFVAAPGLAWVLKFDPHTSAVVVRYLRIDGVGHVLTCLSLVGAAALRGAGNMRAPMLILGFVSVLNVITTRALAFGVGPFPRLGLDFPVLPPLGVDGIVFGTVIARLCGGVLMLAALGWGISGLKLVRGELRLRGNTARRILRIGVPAALDGAISWMGQLFFLMIVSRAAIGPYKNAAFAAHMVGIRVEAITYLPAVAWGYAAAAMVGQSLGAGDRRRALQAGHEASLQCGLLGCFISLTFLLGAPWLYAIMHDDPTVRALGVPAFRMLALFQVPLVLSIVYVFALRGAGDTRFSMWVTAASMFGVRLPLAWYFGIYREGGLFGAWIGMCVDIAVRAALISLRYARGRWMEADI